MITLTYPNQTHQGHVTLMTTEDITLAYRAYRKLRTEYVAGTPHLLTQGEVSVTFGDRRGQRNRTYVHSLDLR